VRYHSLKISYAFEDRHHILLTILPSRSHHDQFCAFAKIVWFKRTDRYGKIHLKSTFIAQVVGWNMRYIARCTYVLLLLFLILQVALRLYKNCYLRALALDGLEIRLSSHRELRAQRGTNTMCDCPSFNDNWQNRYARVWSTMNESTGLYTR